MTEKQLNRAYFWAVAVFGGLSFLDLRFAFIGLLVIRYLPAYVNVKS